MSRKFFLPQSCKRLNFNINDIYLIESAIKRLITHHTHDEEGVRELERKIDEIILKLNWVRLTSNNGNKLDALTNYHCKQLSSAKFPLKITSKMIDKIFL
jgi:ATP-dependent Lon protease